LWLLQTQKQPRNQTPSISSRPRGMNYEKTITLLDVNKNLNVLRRERKHCLFWYCFPLFFTPWVFYILVPWFLLLTIQSFNFILIYLNLKLKKCSAPFFWWDLQAHLNGKGGFHANLFFFFNFGSLTFFFPNWSFQISFIWDLTWLFFWFPCYEDLAISRKISKAWSMLNFTK
jgi:hypothetical protein